MNLVDGLRANAKKRPDHWAIVGPGADARLSYGALWAAIEELAQKLRSLNVEPGMCIGLHVESGIDYVVANYAIWLCGACVVPVAVELAPEEKHRIIAEIGVDGVIGRKMASFLDSANGEVSLKDGLFWAKASAVPPRPPAFRTMNAAFLRFTSGTTGQSKGVILSHETILERIVAANAVLDLGPDDRVVWLLSMAYHFAVSIVAYLHFGATIVLCPNHFASTVIETTRRFGGTFMYGAPVHYELLAHDAESAGLPTLRRAISTTAALPPRTADAFSKRFGLPLSQAYGIIEIGLPCINVDSPAEKQHSVGKPLPAYEVRFVDVGLGRGLGLIQFRGPGLLDAYYEPWTTREEILDGGWFSTGDLGEIDAEGYVFIRNRLNEAISVGGMKFFPQEVEAVLDRHPAVLESHVFPVVDDRLGELAQAHVVLRPADGTPLSEDDLKSFCAAHLASFKLPARIESVSALSRNANGKLLRRRDRIRREM